MLARRIAAVVAAVVAGAGAAAASAVSASAAVAAPAPRLAAPGVRTMAPGAPVVRNLPAAFRLPPGSRVTDLSDRASGASFTLADPGPEAVLSFYRDSLPRAAFTIVADRVTDGTTSLAFRDDAGWAGAIFATPQRVTVAVRRS
ncbi:hypothetical protein [Symbioplanes lichenis]|uniref:hypothetical protein n=1 Tax=Symbioplanes lichenis TaxID=1629072 RepID=UPI002739380C|nr:hypothetical protein [Actinoplanes lichenis]